MDCDASERVRYTAYMFRKPILQGKNVALVAMTIADQAQFQEWLQHPALRMLIDDPRIPTMEDQMRWFARVQQSDRRFFSLVTVEDEQLIGNAGFVDIDPAKKEATLRITIGHPDATGKGYGSEAVTLLVRYAFEVVGWKRLVLKVLASNMRAIRVYEKAGFRSFLEDVQDGKTISTMQLLRP